MSLEPICPYCAYKATHELPFKLIKEERDLVTCRDPDSQEYAELEAMEKDLDDLEMDEFCLELQETKTKEMD
jgi:hypothetical protein